MEREQRRSVALAIIVSLVVIGSVVYFFWGNLINRGTLKVIADAPFEVEIFGGETYRCLVSPCEIGQKIGTKKVVLMKENRKTIILDAKVKLWRTTGIEEEFEVEPYLVRTEKVAANGARGGGVDYELVFDDETGMQKLVKAGDGNEIAIVYFPREIKSPKIVGSKSTALVIDRSNDPWVVYKVRVDGKTREKFDTGEAKGLGNGEWSYDGKYFVFGQGEELWMMGDEMVRLDLEGGMDRIAWTTGGELLFVIEDGGGFSFGKYYPEGGGSKILATFSELKGLPKNLKEDSNGIYFEVGDNEAYLAVME